MHRGALVALGYWNDPERTAERFQPAPGPRRRHHAPPSSPCGRATSSSADEDGFLYFVGRNDEMIKTSGYRVSPTEIEEVAYGTGLVRDAVALGVEDPRLGQRIVLVVSSANEQLDAGDAARPSCSQQLPLYMVPSDVVVRAELPRSPNSKFDRNLLRQELAA